MQTSLGINVIVVMKVHCIMIAIICQSNMTNGNKFCVFGVIFYAIVLLTFVPYTHKTAMVFCNQLKESSELPYST